MSFGSTKSFFQGYMLEVASIVSVVTAMGIVARMGASWPQFPFFIYAGTALVAAFMAYATAFTGMWAYLTTNTGVISSALHDTGNLETFISLLSEPCAWGNRTLVLTLAYFASAYWPANITLTIGLQIASLAAITTVFVSILRNFHLLKLYLKHSIEHAAEDAELHKQLTEQIVNRLSELEDEEEKQSDEAPK